MLINDKITTAAMRSTRIVRAKPMQSPAKHRRRLTHFFDAQCVPHGGSDYRHACIFLHLAGYCCPSGFCGLPYVAQAWQVLKTLQMTQQNGHFWNTMTSNLPTWKLQGKLAPSMRCLGWPWSDQLLGGPESTALVIIPVESGNNLLCGLLEDCKEISNRSSRPSMAADAGKSLEKLMGRSSHAETLLNAV